MNLFIDQHITRVQLQQLFLRDNIQQDKIVEEIILSQAKEIVEQSDDIKALLEDSLKNQLLESNKHYQEYLRNRVHQNLLQIQHDSLTEDSYLKNKAKKALEAVKEKIANFLPTLIGLDEIPNSQELEEVLDIAEHPTLKKIRNLSLKNLKTMDLLSLTDPLNIKDEGFAFMMAEKLKQEAVDEISDEFIDGIFKKTTNKMKKSAEQKKKEREDEFKAFEEREEESLFDLFKNIFKKTVVNSAKITKAFQ